jgi:hypothetical protein
MQLVAKEIPYYANGQNDYAYEDNGFAGLGMHR